MITDSFSPKLSPTLKNKKKKQDSSEVSPGLQGVGISGSSSLDKKIQLSKALSQDKPSPTRNSKGMKPTLSYRAEISRSEVAKKRKEQLEKKKRNYQLANKITYSNNNLPDIAAVLESELDGNDPGNVMPPLYVS